MTAMMKAIPRTFRASVLLYFFLHSPCDARRTGRRREEASRKLKEGKHCKGKSKGYGGKEGSKYSTCSPTSSPSRSPSFTPSAKPSKSPSKSPSDAPSAKPSASPAPSASPSANPSSRPSASPSATPSAKPSASPSKSPSAAPSGKPSVSPSASPSAKPTAKPSKGPSSSPSDHPSASPSKKPSSAPSSGPTPAPSTSYGMSKTISIGSKVRDTCVLSEPSEMLGGNYNEDQLLVFEYLVFTPGTIVEAEEKDDVVDEMEQKIHLGLIQEFLKCDFEAENVTKDFYVFGISHTPSDSITTDLCDPVLVAETLPTPPDGSKCMVVQAQVEMQVYFPRVRRRILFLPRSLEPVSTTYADPQVMAETGEYLGEAMSEGDFNDDEVLQTRFLGFVTNESGHATLDGGENKWNVAAAEGQLMAQKKSRVVGGAMTMAAAAICLIVILALILYRRKKRSEAFANHVDGMSTFSFKDELDGPDTEIVGDTNSWFGDGDDPHGIAYFEERDKNKKTSEDRQDVHRCNSAFCPICLKEQNPTFIKSDSLNIPDILEDLRGGCTVIVDDQSSASSKKYSDTVIL